MNKAKRPIRVFLCHSTQDKPAVRELYERLNEEGWIDPWLDEEKLYLGQQWELAIEKALRAADAVIIFLSQDSVQKEGYVQRELDYAWKISLEKPKNVIFLIPVRLNDVEVPDILRERQWGDYFGEEKEKTYGVLLRSLQNRHNQVLGREKSVSVYETNVENTVGGKYIGQRYNWIEKEKLGEGVSGEVILVYAEGESSTTGVLKKSPSSQFFADQWRQSVEIQREEKVLQALSTLRIKRFGYEIGVPRLLDRSYNDEQTTQNFIVMEKAPGKNLLSILSEHEQPVSRIILLRSFSGLLLLLDTIHEKGIIWNDAKIDHIYWDPIQKVITIIDWANGHFVESGGITKDKRFSFGSDHIQFVEMVGWALKTYNKKLFTELDWPDPESWNKDTEILNKLRDSLSNVLEQESKMTLQDHKSDNKGKKTPQIISEQIEDMVAERTLSNSTDEPVVNDQTDIFKNALEAERLMNEAESLFYKGQYEEAIKIYDLVLSIEQYWERAREHRDLATVYLNEGTIPEVALPKEVAILYGSAISLFRAGRFKAALDLINQAKGILYESGFKRWKEGEEFEAQLLETLQAEEVANEGIRLFKEGKIDEAIEKLDIAYQSSISPRYKDILDQYRQFRDDTKDISSILLKGHIDPKNIVTALEKIQAMQFHFSNHPVSQNLQKRIQRYIPLISEDVIQEINVLKNNAERTVSLDEAITVARLTKSKVDQALYLGIPDESLKKVDQEVNVLIDRLSEHKKTLARAEKAYQHGRASEAWKISGEVRNKYPHDQNVLELNKKLSAYRGFRILLVITILIIVILFLVFGWNWANHYK